MSSEGELKKRIERLDEAVHEKRLCMTTIEDVLDEAKKELATVDVRIGRHQNDSRSDSEIIVEKSKEYRKLIEKWFGASK
jgi:hypothetical protein